MVPLSCDLQVLILWCLRLQDLLTPGVPEGILLLNGEGQVGSLADRPAGGEAGEAGEEP